ncbi:MAG TPA: hypothetical protein VJX70_13500 [Candidatus Acidoferrum sp.]|nr:hypothetical protein [Candidatus Acidoferrum sp.]
MAEEVARYVVDAMYAYALLGGLFGVFFVVRGVQKVDQQAQGTGIGFRLLIFPGAAAFWPLLLKRWIGGTGEPPEERNPHR